MAYKKQGFYAGEPLKASQLEAMEEGIIEAQRLATENSNEGSFELPEGFTFPDDAGVIATQEWSHSNFVTGDELEQLSNDVSEIRGMVENGGSSGTSVDLSDYYKKSEVDEMLSAVDKTQTRWYNNILISKDTKDYVGAYISAYKLDNPVKIKIHDLHIDTDYQPGIGWAFGEYELASPDQTFDIVPNNDGSFSVNVAVNHWTRYSFEDATPLDEPILAKTTKTLHFSFGLNETSNGARVTTITCSDLQYYEYCESWEDTPHTWSDHVTVSLEIPQTPVGKEDFYNGINELQEQINEFHDEWVCHLITPTGQDNHILIFHQEGVYFAQPTHLRVSSNSYDYTYTNDIAWGETLYHPGSFHEEQDKCTYEYGEYTQEADGKTGNYVKVVSPEPFSLAGTIDENLAFLTAIRYEKSVNERLSDLTKVVDKKANEKDVVAKISKWKDFNVYSDFPGCAMPFYGCGTPTKVKGDVTVHISNWETGESTEHHYTFEQEGLDDIAFDDGNVLGFKFFSVLDWDTSEYLNGGIALYLKGDYPIEVDPGANGIIEPGLIDGAMAGQHWAGGSVSFYTPEKLSVVKAVEEVSYKVSSLEEKLGTKDPNNNKIEGLSCKTPINDNKEPGTPNYSLESERAQVSSDASYEGATGLNTFAFGEKLTVGGESAVGFGKKNISNNNQTFVSGQGNEIIGKYGFGAGGGNNKQLGDYGFVAGNKNVSAGIKNFTTGSYNFSGGTASLVSGEFNTEAYFAIDLNNKKLYKSWVNPLNANNNIFDSEKSEILQNVATETVSGRSDGPDYYIEDITYLPTGITGIIEGGYPESDLTKVTINTKNINWSSDEYGSYATIKTEEGLSVYLTYYPNEKYIELSCRDFFACITNLNLMLYHAKDIEVADSKLVASFKIDSTQYHFGKDYYGNMIVGTGLKEVTYTDGTVNKVVSPEKARCYKYSDNVYLFSLELDNHIPFNNLIGGNANSIRLGSENILAGANNKILNGSKNILAGSYNTISGGQNIVNGFNNIIKGTSNFVIGDNNTFTVEDVQGGAAIGIGLQIARTNQVFVGEYNKPNESILFGVGNGSSDNRQNAFTVHQSGAVTAKKVPETNYEVLRLEDFVPSSNGNLSTKNGLDIKVNSIKANDFITAKGDSIVPASTNGARKIPYVTDGAIAWYEVSGDVKSNAVVKRNGSQIKVTTPKADNDAASKGYVDEAIAKVATSEMLNSKLNKVVEIVIASETFNDDAQGLDQFELSTSSIDKSTAYIHGSIEVITELSPDGIRSTHEIAGKVGDTINLGGGKSISIDYLYEPEWGLDDLRLKSSNCGFCNYTLTVENKQTVDIVATITKLQEKIALLESKIN